MRCASCGTENAPDSRFCGGCGARLGASGPRVAPTQKISDDASFPQRPATPAPGPRPSQVAHGSAQPSAPRKSPKTPFVPNAPPVITTQPGVVPPQRPASAPPVSAPPAGYSPPSAPPHAPNGAPRPAPRFEEPSISMPTVARRPWGLIVFVLIIDVALAVTGAWMLSQGLGDRQSAKNTAPRSGAMTPPGTPSSSGAPAATTATGAAPATSRPPSPSR